MSTRSLHFRIGLGACAAAAFLVLVAIPQWVSSPSNVNNIVLSPTFWPYVLAGMTALVGLGLIAGSLRAKSGEEDAGALPETGNPAAWMRLVSLAVIMALTMFAMPRLGMVWTAMLAFLATAFLFRTRHPVVAVICAILIPLLLYAFFAHVAGVAIPQGEFVRLP